VTAGAAGLMYGYTGMSRTCFVDWVLDADELRCYSCGTVGCFEMVWE